MRKGKDGYYKKSFTHNGKREYVRARTRDELEEKIRAKKESLEQGEKNLINPVLNDYYQHFTDVRSELVQAGTIRSQKIQYEIIAGVIMPNGKAFGEMRINDITRRDIEDARQILLDAGKTPEHLNNSFAHLNHVFNNAVLDETIIKNPCKALKQIRRKAAPVGETKHRALSIDETIRFFDTAAARNSYYLNAYMLMIKTGMRIGEISALIQEDIDTNAGFIRVRKTVKRDEIGRYYIGDNTKTKSGMRDIPINTDIVDIIAKQERLNTMVFGANWSGVLFKSAEGEILREYQANREIKRICKQAGIEEFTCHAFRNTFATRFIEQRPQDYKVLSEILGHKDIGITLNLYTHVMQESKINAMNDIFIKIS